MKMRLVLSIAALLTALSVQAGAQEAPGVEVFGGYSFLRPQGGGSFNGWEASVAVNIKKYFELESDFSGHYGAQSVRAAISDPGIPGTITIRANNDTSMHHFLFGPRFSYRTQRNLTPFAHFLFGASHLRTKAVVTVGDLASEINFGDTGFAFAAGGGLDLKLSDSIGLRLVQVDYLQTTFGNSSQSNARVSVGIVIH